MTLLVSYQTVRNFNTDPTSYIKRHKKACIGGTSAGIVLLLLLLFLLIFPLDRAEEKTKAVLGTSADMETTEGLATTKATEGIETSEQTETAVSETTLATTAETIAAATPTSTPKPTPKPTAATTPSTTATTAETTTAATTAATTTLATEPPTPIPSTYPTEEEMEAYIWNVVVSHRTSAGYGTPTYDQAMTDRAQLYSDPDTTSWSILAQVDVHGQVTCQTTGVWSQGNADWQSAATAVVNSLLSSWETYKDTTGQTLCGVGVGYELRPSGVYFYSVWICFAKVT